MAAKMSNDELRRELAKFGEKVGKIDAKTRPIHEKKLNHLRARDRAAEKPTTAAAAPRRRTRAATTADADTKYLLDFDDYSDNDDEVSKKTMMTIAADGERTTRRRTLQGGVAGDLGSTPTKIGARRSTRSFIEDHNVSWPVGTGGSTPGRNGTYGSKVRDVGNGRKATPGSMDFSDSEQMDESKDEIDTASVGINTSSWMDLSSGSIFGNKSHNQSRIANTSVDRPAVTPVRSNMYRSDNHYDQWSSQNLGSEVENSGKWQCISKLLLGCVLVFFLTLVSLYCAVRLGLLQSLDSTMSENLLCAAEDLDCNTKLKILVEIKNFLASRAGDHDCGEEDISRSISRSDLMNFLKRNGKSTDLKSILMGISERPMLRISMLDENLQVTEDHLKVSYLESLEGNMSFLCRLRRSFVEVAMTLFIVVVGFLAIGCVIFLVKRKLKRRGEETKEVHRLVHDIISLLQHHSSESQSLRSPDPYLSVLHVRDALIPLEQREEKNHLWEKAVSLISENESRIREEVQLVAGKKECVWRWLDASAKDLPRQPENKSLSWANTGTNQISAFLKVSNILGDSGYLDNNVRDSILERCGEYHGILHLDSFQNCIFLKCVSESSAGQAFKFLHGWLYKGQLVSVKYETPLLYRTLFPESVNAMVPLRPSTYQRRRSGHFATTDATNIS